MKKYKRILYIPLFLGLTTFSNAATRGDVQIINSSENIMVLSNKIMKNYILMYLGKAPEEKEKELLSKVSNELRNISKNTSKERTKNIIDFLSYNKTELNKALKDKEITKEDLTLVLDYVESFLEGAKSISKEHSYEFSESEVMFTKTKRMAALLDDIYIYYFISSLGLNTEMYEAKLNKSIETFTADLDVLKAQDYSDELKKIVTNLDVQFKSDKTIISKKNDYFLPLILNDFIVYQNDEIQKLTEFHGKN